MQLLIERKDDIKHKIMLSNKQIPDPINYISNLELCVKNILISVFVKK